jgi:hypothetical protein
MSIYSATFTERLADSFTRQQTLIDRDVLDSLLIVGGFEPQSYTMASHSEDISGIDLWVDIPARMPPLAWVSTPSRAIPVALRDKGVSSLKYNDFTLTKWHASGVGGEMFTSKAELYVFTYWDDRGPVLSRLVNMAAFLPLAGEIPHKVTENRRNGQSFAAFDWGTMEPYIMATWRANGPQTTQTNCFITF